MRFVGPIQLERLWLLRSDLFRLVRVTSTLPPGREAVTAWGNPLTVQLHYCNLPTDIMRHLATLPQLKGVHDHTNRLTMSNWWNFLTTR